MDDTEVMLRVSRGDRPAFELLVKSHQSRIVNLMYRLVGDAHDAEDLAQEVFMRVYRARDRYEPRAKFSTWLYRISYNVAANHLRSRRADRVPLEAISELAAPRSSDDLETAERVQIVRKALRCLPDSQRAALILTKFEACSYEEAAGIMNTTKAAVRSLISRGKHALRHSLQGRLEVATSAEAGT